MVFLRKWFLTLFQTSERGWLCLILVWAMILRVKFWFQPIRYDEAFTYLYYAARPLPDFVADYSYPNNHVFHTIGVFISTRLLGSSEWAIRVPTFLAGLATVGMSYLLFKRWYSSSVGLLTATLTASLGLMVEYSTNARGYMLQTALFLLLFFLADIWRQTPTLKTLSALVIVGALGFYTVPTMLYGYSLVMLWLLFSLIWEDHPNKPRLIGFWVLAGGVTAGLTLLLYTPILLTDGLSAITDNPFVTPLTWADFKAGLPDSLWATAEKWHGQIPAPLILVLVAGFIVGLIVQQRIARYRIPLWLPLVIGIAPILVWQQVIPYSRVWLFLLPLYLGISASGLAYLADKVSPRLAVGLGFIFMLGIGGNVFRQNSLYDPDESGVLPEVETVMTFLGDQLTDQTRLITYRPSDVVLEYYFFREGRRAFYQTQTQPHWAQTVYLVVNETYHPLELVFRGVTGYSQPVLLQDLGVVSLYQVDWLLTDEWLAQSLELQVWQDWSAGAEAGRVFNPRTDARDVMTFIGMFENQAKNEAEQTLIDQWRADKQAHYLLEAGFEYLMVERDWWSWLSEADALLLSDTSHYELLQEWRNPATGEFFQVYRLKG